jgi:uncharacterized protein (DUF983 family)
MFGRGIRRCCPWCGSRKSFIRHWLGKHERCQTCGIRWRREPGMEFGALMLNTMVTFFALAVAMTIGFILTVPEVPVGRLIAICMVVAVGLPLAIYPFTFTVWLAVDLAGNRPEGDELLEAARIAAETSTTA